MYIDPAARLDIGSPYNVYREVLQFDAFSLSFTDPYHHLQHYRLHQPMQMRPRVLHVGTYKMPQGASYPTMSCPRRLPPSHPQLPPPIYGSGPPLGRRCPPVAGGGPAVARSHMLSGIRMVWGNATGECNTSQDAGPCLNTMQRSIEEKMLHASSIGIVGVTSIFHTSSIVFNLV